MSKKGYFFIFEGIADSGAKISPSPVWGYGTTKDEAKQNAKEKFICSKHAIKITRCTSK